MPAARDKAPREPSAQPARPARPVRRAAPPALLRLQASAGNAAVTGLVALQRQGCAAPPVAPTGVTPASDPKFQSLRKDVSGQAKAAKAHPPAGAEVKKAQDASVAPADDKEAQAKATQADKMAAAKPAGFDKAAFIAAVNAAVAKQAPQNLDDADKFATSGKADQIKSEVMGKVTSGKDASAKDVTDRTKEAPDTSRAVEKPVTPLPQTPAPPALAAPDPRKATPDKAPPEQTDLRADQCETQGKMAEAEVSDQQLAQSNEPEFTGALAAKQQGEQHTASAPAAVRESEAGQLAAVTGAAQASGQAAMAGMTGARSTSGQKGQAAKSATKSKDEQDRARITGEIKAIFSETKTKVEGVLGALDDQVAKRFQTGEAAAKAAFTADHQARMKRYKDDRYDGITGAARWAYDLFASLPAEANNLFLEARKVYETKMQGVVSDIADFVGQQLGEAKRLIAEGRTRVQQKVDSQSPALRKIAGQAAKEFGSQFDDLEKSVDEKQDSLVEDLAQKYSEARNAVDEEIKALQAENKGLWDKAKEAIGGAIETILKLKDMLLGVLARAANAVGLIIKKPIEFLGNLVNAVKTGVMNFGANIAQHLKDGLKAWLLGNLASAGIEIPETLDAKGILKMIMSILGLTWASVRARILRFIPEPVLAKLEQTLEVVKILITEGVPGLWRWVIEKLGDLKEMVLGQIKEFVIEKIVKAGITWIISLLNPAAAFIKACKAIYDIVMFFVDKAAQIKEFVDSVLDSVESIARGGAGAVAGLIERTLAKALPMVLGFLASLLGLGGISEKIKSILEKVQAPVGKVIDTVVGTIVKAGKKIWSKLKGKKDKRSPGERKAALDAAMTDGQAVLHDRSLDETGIKARLAAIKNARKVKRLELAVDQKTEAAETVHIVGANSPTVHGPPVARIPQKVAQLSDEVTADGPKTTVPLTVSIDWSKPPATQLIARGLNRAEITRLYEMAPTANADNIKGAILEALLSRRHEKTHPSTPGKPARTAAGAPKPEFIAGHRIYQQRQFSDGILATLGANSGQRVVKIHKIFEAKASQSKLYKIASESERYSRIGKAEKAQLRTEAIQALVERYHAHASDALTVDDTRTPQQVRQEFVAARNQVLSEHADKIEPLMEEMFRQSAGGQAARNRERVSPDVDTRENQIGDVPAKLRIDTDWYDVVGYSPQETVTVVVVPGNVRPGGITERLAEQGISAEVEQIDGITSQALGTLASAVKAAAGKGH